ncbi:MAG: electron transfer flavoprotein subunit alpha/FixB family protein [Puniceicoccaceae bacterium]
MKVLVIAEADGGKIRKASLSALTLARQLGGDIEILLIGHSMDMVTSDAARFGPVIVAESPELEHPLADRFAAIICNRARDTGTGYVIAAATSWSKDIVGRAAGLLGGTMASDIVGHEEVGEDLVLKRPMFAGELLARVRLSGEVKVLTVRASAYDAAEPLETPATVKKIDLSSIVFPGSVEYLGLDVKQSDRPDATEASVVVSGGRAFKSAEDYEHKVGALADRLGAAVGATRAIVDEGIVPNELQIGQTGKIVAPDLYLALGLSGAIQHLAGISNSKIIAAVNKDPEAPIFSVADYGLVADVHEVVPELIDKLG